MNLSESGSILIESLYKPESIEEQTKQMNSVVGASGNREMRLSRRGMRRVHRTSKPMEAKGGSNVADTLELSQSETDAKMKQMRR